MSEVTEMKLRTPEFRGSFVQVAEPRAFKKGDPEKYSVLIPIEKGHPFFEALEKKIEAACMKKWNEVPKKLARKFMKDGDLEEEKYGWEGMQLITCSNKSQPGMVVKTDEGLIEPINPKEEMYSGAYYIASIRPYPYEYEGAKGVAISLDNILKTKDGEKFTSKTTAEEDFSDFAEDEWA